MLTIPAKSRGTVSFGISSIETGTARYQLMAFADNNKVLDASQGQFPVYTPNTTEGFAGYGSFPGESEEYSVGMPSNPTTSLSSTPRLCS